MFGAPGKDTTTTDGFSAELGTERPGQVQTVSMDMGPAFAASVGANAPAATIAIDPFHAVKLVGEVDIERRKAWNELRESGDPEAARKLKGARWSLLKNPENLTEDQAATLRKTPTPRRTRLFSPSARPL